MTHIRAKLIIATILILGPVGFLMWTGFNKANLYYLTVDQLLSDQEKQTQRVRLSGRVAEDSVEDESGLLAVGFELLGPSQKMPVIYKGVVPDSFKSGIDVVLEGKVDDAGVFQADVMMTKCASKYQAEEHAKKLENES